MAQAHRVGACRNRPHRTLLDTHGAADRAHLERIRHDQTAEAQLLSQEPVQELATHRGRCLPERAHDNVRGHDRLYACFDRGTKRKESLVLERFDDGELHVRVLQGVAVPGEVLRAGRHSRAALQPADECRDVPRDKLALRPKRADPDDRVLRVRVHVCDRGEVEIDSGLAKISRDRRRHLLGELHVVDRAESSVSRIRAPCRDLQPRHVSAFLVDRYQDVIPPCPERGR
ncbi:MAG: hypothetical protein WD041_02775 [Nitriliruptoraceae bacterium]